MSAHGQSVKTDKVTESTDVRDHIFFCGGVIQAGRTLTKLHSERPKNVYSFGLSQCNRVNKMNYTNSA